MDAVLVMFKADGQRREFPLTQSLYVMGRKHSCDLRIPISSVSREHCQVEVRDDGIYLRDLGSSNGTYQNEFRVQETKLRAGDRITVGPVHFTLVIDGQPAEFDEVPTVLPNNGEVQGPGASQTLKPDDVEAAAAAAEAVEATSGKSSAGSVVLDDDESSPMPDDQHRPEKPTSSKGSKTVPPAPAPKAKPAPAPVQAVDAEVQSESPTVVDHDSGVVDDDPLAALAALAGGGDHDGGNPEDILAGLGQVDDDDVPVLFDEDEKKPRKK